MDYKIEAVEVGTMRTTLPGMPIKAPQGKLFKITHFANAIDDKGLPVKILGKVEHVSREGLQMQIDKLQAKLDSLPKEE